MKTAKEAVGSTTLTLHRALPILAEPMDAALLGNLIGKNKPFRIETASGRVFNVPHRDFISFTSRKTAVVITFDENDQEHFAIVPLLTVTAAMART